MAAEQPAQPETERPRPESPQAGEATQVFTPVAVPSLSDVVLANAVTGPAPSLPAPVPPVEKRPGRDQAPLALLPGARVDDFEIVRLLGRGSFGHVYLARQLSLDRLVALKISANRGSEGRTMARLEHQHIVQVFSEKVDSDFNQRLLCMQLVSGVSLERLIGLLHAVPSSGKSSKSTPWTGAELLAIIDRSASLPAALDPSALHDREALARMDSVEASAWLGARLGEALDFAHRHGVLHRDIKPANILVNTYGRPLLADFNISSQPVGSEPSGEEMFGGTFVYMAPEHLDAFNPNDPTGHEAVTARSDIYSLGLVLHQLLDGRLPVSLPERRTNMVQMLRTLADERRAPPALSGGMPSARKTLDRTIIRCLEPQPEARFSSAAELAEQLEGCRQLRQAERQLPPPPKLLAPALRKPLLWLIILVLLPQLAGSVVNISYNYIQIVAKLEKFQELRFHQLVFWYNLIVYPVAMTLGLFAIWPIWRCWNALERGQPIEEESVRAARQRALQLPGWIAALTAGGWFPGGILFPLLIPDLDFRLKVHFFISFYLSGLIALAYSLCGAQFVVLRGLYPGMWCDVRSFRQLAQDELAPVVARLKHMQFLAGSIPLLAAVLTLGFSGDNSGERSFKLLVVCLIILGALGYHFASAVCRGLSQVVVALTSAKS